MTNGSGDYAIAFSTSEGVRRTTARRAAISEVQELSNDVVTPLFQAVVEATEEAVLNSMFKATSMEGHVRRIEALPVEEVLRLHRRARAAGRR
jgi:D-aminopeptidase